MQLAFLSLRPLLISTFSTFLALSSLGVEANNTTWTAYSVKGLSQDFKSLGEAEAAMRSRPGATNSRGTTDLNSKLQFSWSSGPSTRQYVVPPVPATHGPWSYRVAYYPGGPYDNEDAAVQNLIDYFSSPQCDVTASPTSGWYTSGNLGPEYVAFWYGGVQFRRNYDLIKNCPNRPVSRNSVSVQRRADPICPANYEATSSVSIPALQNPVGEEYVLMEQGCRNPAKGTISSSILPLICDANRNPRRGNPCNPATGNKHESEEDFLSLGDQSGISFLRSYNSLQISQQETSLGLGWSHNYATRIIGANPQGISWGSGQYERLKLVSSGIYISEWGTGRQVRKSASGWILNHPNGAQEIFDAAGRLVKTISAEGHVTALISDSLGRLQQVIGPYGHGLTFTYYADGKLSSVTDSSNRTVQYSYSGDVLSQVIRADGSIRSYHYEMPGFPSHLTGVSFNSSRYSTFGFDQWGRATLSEHANGMEKHTLSYVSNGTTTVTDAAGTPTVYHFSHPSSYYRVVTKEVDPVGTRSRTYNNTWTNLTSITDERGNKTSYTYDAYHRTSMTEADGTPQARTTTYQYLNDLSDLPTLVEKPSVYAGQKSRTAVSYQDIRFPNLPTSITQSGYTPAGASVSRTVGVTYNLNGQVAEIDGPRTDVADITRYDYYLCNTGGNCGQLRTVTNALGQITRYEDYDAAGRVGRIVAPNGLTTSYTYDPAGRVSQTVSSSGGASRTTALTYTPAGDIATVTQPDGVQLTYTYDAARKLRNVTDSHGNKVEYDYDSRGNRTKEDLFNPDGTQVSSRSYTYDLRNRIQALNSDIDATRTSITTLVSDAVGNLLSEKDPNTNATGGTLATNHEYDSLNRLFRTTDVKFGVTSYDYDVNDQVIAVTAPNNAVTTYSYDDLGNRLSEDSPDRGLTNYAYDATGNLISRHDARGVTALFSYDALNRVTAVDYPGTEEDVQFGYDCPTSIGRRCQITDGSGTQVFEHDGFGNVLKHTRSGAWGSFVTEYTYDAGNRVGQVISSSGTQATYTRDDLGRVIGVRTIVDGQQKTLISGRNYRADGLPTAQFFGNGLVESRGYDLSGRLKQINLAGEVWNHEYDWNNNLTLRQSPASTDQFEYDELNRLDGFTLGTLSSASYTYDKNGNRLSETLNGATYQHDYFNASNRMLSRAGSPVSHDEVGNRTSHGLRTLTYNSANRLSQVLEQGLVVATYVYDGLGRRVQKITNSGTTLYHYGLNGELIAETNVSGSRLRDYIWLDAQPLAQVEANGNILFLHTDHLATPRLASNVSGQVVWRWNSAPFGETSPTQDPDGDGIATIVNLRFPGQYYDSESGLHYNYFRDYDPQTGRYVESDPIGLDGGLNTYGYVSGNPLIFIDPQGLAAQACLIPPIGAVCASAATGLVNILGMGAAYVGLNSISDGNEESFPQWSPMGGESWPDRSEQKEAEKCPTNADCYDLGLSIDILVQTIKMRRAHMAELGGDWGHEEKVRILRRKLGELVRAAKARGCPYNPEANILML